jgi:pantothenate kinase
MEQRVELLLRTAHFCPEHLVTVASRPEVALMTLTELWRFYLPICQLFLKMACAAPRRILVGITGPPGSGKSVFAALLADLLNECVTGAKDPGAVVCPMDGFHYSNSYLETHYATDEGGNEIPLLSKKGAPETFDVSAFVRCLDRLRSERTVAVPAYDRRTHDVMPAGIRVAARHRIVLVEGNYLLLNREGWAEIAPRLALSVFLRLPLDAARDFIIRRHVRGGRTHADAVRHFEEVDRKNYDVCMSSSAGADIIVRRTAGHRIIAIMPGRGK